MRPTRAWRSPAGRVIRGTQDGFLYALDAKTGAPLWVRQVADWSVGEGIGAAPIVWNDLVYVAKAGGDWGIRGRMMAFKVADGSLAWSFDLIPQPGAAGADSWKNPASMQHGGGAAWVTYALDQGQRHAVRAGRQSRARLCEGPAARGESVHDLHGRHRCQAAASSSGGTSCAPTTITTGTRPS